MTCGKYTVQDFLNELPHWWIWGKLTDEEKAAFAEVMWQWAGIVKGSDSARRSACKAMMDSYIKGLGFDGLTWRS